MTAELPAEFPGVVVIGGGPAGLAAAETARTAGAPVMVCDALGSVGRKFLLAGKGGLNLTHAEAYPAFVSRYREASGWVADWLQDFDAQALRDWAAGLGVDTFVGSSGRVFPSDLKAAPLLRRWLRRLRESGVQFQMRHRWLGWAADGALRFATPDGERRVHSAATVFALGGGSWPQLGSDGRWQAEFTQAGVPVAPLKPANCGFDTPWSPYFIERFAGAPLKPVVAQFNGSLRQGECIITATGIEGSLIYALSSRLRRAVERDGQALLELDLVPGQHADELRARLARPRGKRTQAEHLRRAANLDPLRTALLRERLSAAELADTDRVAALLKAFPVPITAARPLAEAISSAGGVRLDALDEGLMLQAQPGTFCCGEMLDWEAPTGGYLLTACFASGRRAGTAAARRLDSLAQPTAA